MAEIKKLSEHCEFGTALNDSSRDRFVCGLYNESIQKRLLVETSLTFEKALKLAVAMETATKDSLELRGKAKTIPPVNNIREVPKQHKCYRYGKEGHEPQECYFKDQYCRNCGKKGHIKRVRRQSRTQSNACARARMALALGKLNFSCAVIGLTCMPTKPEPLNLGVPVVKFPQSQCHPSPRTGIALGTRLVRRGKHLNKIPLPNQVRARKRARKYIRFKTKAIVIARTHWRP